MDDRRPSLLGAEDVYKVTTNMTFLQEPNVIITHTKDDEEDQNVKCFDEIESQLKNNKQFRRQKPRVLLQIALFSLILGIILISSVLFLPQSGSQKLSVEELPESTEQILETRHAPGDANKDLIIRSAQDFKLLEPFHSSVDILGIDERYEGDFPFLLPIVDNVKNIKISGPISPEWLYFLMRKFPAVSTLTIDLKKICSTKPSFKNTDDRVIAFENVEKYEIRNFKRCNSKISNFFLSFNFPNLKSFIFENHSFTHEKHVAKFVKNHSYHQLVNFVLGPFQNSLIQKSTV